MMTKWTKEQQAAIDARGCNLLVAAAAGSGKTAVLVERILKLIINDGVDIDRMLVVTFTNAAAGEMRERIESSLLNAIDKNSANEEHLRRQLNLLSSASISTLHSFCIDVLRKYFHVISLDPGFRIADESENIILKMEALDALMEEAYEKGDAEFLGLVDRYGGNRQDAPVKELILNLYDFIQSSPYPFNWLKEKTDAFKTTIDDITDSPWYIAIVNRINMDIRGALDILQEALSVCRMPNGPIQYEAAILDDINQFNSLLQCLFKDPAACWVNASGLEFVKLARCGRDVDDGLKETVKSLRDQAKDIFAGLKKDLFQASLNDYIRDLNELYPYMNYLNKLVISLDELYRNEKEERGIIDFNDLEHCTLKILENEDIANELKDKYSYIFIDEYQDSNIVQETIISRIKRDDNLFMVGDVKQSIYRFRLADPTLFIEKYNTYIDSEAALNRRIDLNKNFRSKANILHGVNYIFSNIMSEDFGEINYDDKAALYPGLADNTSETENAGKAEDVCKLSDDVELHIIDRASAMGKEKDGTNDYSQDTEEQDTLLDNAVDALDGEGINGSTEIEIDDPGSIEIEALAAAKRINELTETIIYDNSIGDYRKLEFRDIVILMRSTKVWAQTFFEILTMQGIPVYADVNSGYFEALEIRTIVDLLRLIDNKKQDIPLLGIMRSPIGSFTADDLIEIRIKSKEKTFYMAAEEYASSHNNDLSKKLSEFYSRLALWQEASGYMQMEDFLWKLYMDTGYYYYVGSMPGGAQRQANLNMLLEKARQFQNTTIRGIFNFLRFIDKLQSSSGDMGAAKVLGENENVLRIMSVHKSKGLEFPVVIVAGLGKGFNLTDSRRQVIIHKDLGIGPKYVDPETRQTCDTIAKIAMKDVIIKESLSEEMRILYVAMTRAKNKLIMLGSAKDVGKRCAKWLQNMSPYNLSRCKSYLDWICSALMRHRDGGSLRKLMNGHGNYVADNNVQLTDDVSNWQVFVHNQSDIALLSQKAEQDASKLKEWLENPVIKEDEDIKKLIEDRFSWSYPFSYAVGIPSKLTVTQIKRINEQRQSMAGNGEVLCNKEATSNGDEPGIGEMTGAMGRTIYPISSTVLLERPKFMEGTKKFTPAEKGTIMHFALQHIKLDGDLSSSGIQAQINEMVEKELLTEEESKVVDIEVIRNFFNSSIGQRILSAEKVWREVPFNYRKEACKVLQGIGECDETLLIQGIIDCYFEEGGQWVLVDYKTDFILNDDALDKAVERYKIQIELYAEALEKITGKPVKERILYLLSIGKGISI